MSQLKASSGSKAESIQYPLVFNHGLAGSSPGMRLHSPRPGIVIVSMKSGPNSWFAPAEINGKTLHFLIDSTANKSVISKEVYDSLLDPKPPIQDTNIRFQVANGSVNSRCLLFTTAATFWYCCKTTMFASIHM